MVNGPHPSAANVSQVNELFSTFPNSFFLLYNSCEEIIIMTEPFLILFEIRLIIVKNLMEFFPRGEKSLIDINSSLIVGVYGVLLRVDKPRDSP